MTIVAKHSLRLSASGPRNISPPNARRSFAFESIESCSAVPRRTANENAAGPGVVVYDKRIKAEEILEAVEKMRW